MFSFLCSKFYLNFILIANANLLLHDEYTRHKGLTEYILYTPIVILVQTGKHTIYAGYNYLYNPNCIAL